MFFCFFNFFIALLRLGFFFIWLCVVAIAGAALGSYLLKKRKKKTSNVPLPKSKPKFSNIQVPVGKPKQTRKPQTLKNVRTESQTFTKRQRPGRSKKETVQVNVY